MEKDTHEYISFLSPEFIYIPFDSLEKLKIKKSKLVLYNSFLGVNNDNKNIFSPVSGKIIGLKEMQFSSKKQNCLVIENNFIDKRDKLNPAKSINKMKKNDIIDLLNKYGLNKNVNSKSTLVVNSFYNKKYDLKDMIINCESYEGILETLDEFMNIFNIKDCYICIDRNDLYSINAYEKYINAFYNICIVHSNKKFKKEKCVFYTIEEVLAIYKAIHQDYMYDNTLITIYENTPIIVKVKLYTSLYEVLRALKISTRKKDIFINNKLVDNVKDFVIDFNVRSVLIKDKKE